jgi:hypothetical protein
MASATVAAGPAGTHAGARDPPNVLMSVGSDGLDGGMQLPQRIARFNRHVTNPIQRMWAGWAPSFAIIEHVGRRSGKPYRTPVNALTADIDGNPEWPSC